MVPHCEYGLRVIGLATPRSTILESSWFAVNLPNHLLSRPIQLLRLERLDRRKLELIMHKGHMQVDEESLNANASAG